MEQVTIIILGGITGVKLNQLLELFKPKKESEMPTPPKYPNNKLYAKMYMKIEELEASLKDAGEYFRITDTKCITKLIDIQADVARLAKRTKKEQLSEHQKMEVIDEIQKEIQELKEIEEDFKNIPDKLQL